MLAHPTDAAQAFHRRQQRFKHMAAAGHHHRRELAAMLLELHANRTALDELANWYGVFVFTGGHIPTARWNLAVVNTYLESPFATDRISTAELVRYRDVAEAIRKLGQAGAGPRTLRCRHDLGERFGQAAAELRDLGNALEAAVTKLAPGLNPGPNSLAFLVPRRTICC